MSAFNKLYIPDNCDAFLVHSLGCGLCNRVPAFACFKAIAVERNAPLYCFWTLDDHCPGLPEDAFERSSFFWNAVNEFEFIALIRRFKHPAVFLYDFTAAPARRFAELAPHHSTVQYWDARVNQYAGSLRPNAAVRAKLESLDRIAVPCSRRMGLHVRRTDLLGRGAPGGPKTNEQRDAALYAKLDAMADAAEPASWIACCDNPASLAELKRRYGNRIVPSGAEWRKQGLRETTLTDAAFDLFALARCPVIIGTAGSTFNATAALMGGSRLERV